MHELLKASSMTLHMSEADSVNATVNVTVTDPQHAASSNEQPLDAPASKLDSIFVEQQSAVQGIRELVMQHSSALLDTMPLGLPPDRGITRAIPLLRTATVLSSKVYQMSKPSREEMAALIKQLLEKG